ncbi:SPOR domain-containing protein [Pontimicrobium aquaticum]|uniref:SPOR domain-containing protein n=2 Tax=Pontimicrobium aquaticum TaxID=2565367 RepID=A0A4U0EMB7_9FLAO|nr:SPOR domain-containing protein [Pontimicrobium aquaticum]
MVKFGNKFLILTFLMSMFFTSAIIAQEGEVVVNQDKQIETLLRLKKEVNKTLVNYRIQIFNGNRQGAEKARDEFVKVFSSWKPDMKFQTPNYKIWVGEFKTRLEADRALLQIKKEFRNAFIIKL